MIIAGIHRVYVTCRLCGLQVEETAHIDLECAALKRNRRDPRLALNCDHGHIATVQSKINSNHYTC